MKKAKFEEPKEPSPKLKEYEIIRLKHAYVAAIFQADFFFARAEMLAEQITSKNIKESVDGCLKTEQYMLSEFYNMKYKAKQKFREAYWAKKELIDTYKLSDEDIEKYLKDYINGPMKEKEPPKE